jgi:hypothetical protein
MSETTIQSAVIDRYEGQFAVVFFADDPDTPVNLARHHLPRRKPKEGAHLKIERRGDEIISITIDKEAAKAARKRIQEKLGRLRRGEHLQDSPPDESPPEA